MKRWTEHFHEVLNQPEPTMLFNFEQESNIASVDISVQDITAQEVIKAINLQKNNKSPGLDGIPAELLKHGKTTLAEELTYSYSIPFGVKRRFPMNGVRESSCHYQKRMS